MHNNYWLWRKTIKEEISCYNAQKAYNIQTQQSSWYTTKCKFCVVPSRIQSQSNYPSVEPNATNGK